MTHRPIADIENALRRAQTEYLDSRGGQSTVAALRSTVLRLSDELKAARVQDAALRHHLEYNIYPPIHLSWMPACAAAIAAVRDEDANRLVALPEGHSFKGADKAPAIQIFELLHLDDLIDWGDNGT